ncbi:hypothetical protein ACEYYB_02730 [Paracoccus sp. p4-l81]|uniref:hypothetical protein n=1 Tax=unclassified Paracoccus (in: a-proteobacteria) TaxID=2688777 RepID=UPI0035B97FF7
MTKTPTETATFLPRGSSVLVVAAGGALSLYPAQGPDDAPIPPMVQLLAAVLMRSADGDWLADMLRMFKHRNRH